MCAGKNQQAGEENGVLDLAYPGCIKKVEASITEVVNCTITAYRQELGWESTLTS